MGAPQGLRSSSTDDGLTFSDPVDMTAQLKPRTMANGSEWAWDAMGPGVGIQTRVSNPGRLIIPAQHRTIYSDDRGVTWKVQRLIDRTSGEIQEQTGEATVLEAANGCQASPLRYNNDAPARVMFLNSASTETRTKMRIRMSYDDGRTWPISRPPSDAPLAGESTSSKEGGYSSMAKTADYHVGALVEVNENVGANSTSHHSIAFRKVNLPWILNGQAEPS